MLMPKKLARMAFAGEPSKWMAVVNGPMEIFCCLLCGKHLDRHRANSLELHWHLAKRRRKLIHYLWKFFSSESFKKDMDASTSWKSRREESWSCFCLIFGDCASQQCLSVINIILSLIWVNSGQVIREEIGMPRKISCQQFFGTKDQTRQPFEE